MSKTVLADVSGFTPIIDDLARELGHTTAAVFGVVWRHCQMRDSVCRASLSTICDYIGIDRSTVSRHLEVLVAHGYLTDLTPGLKGKPHIYSDTGKAGIRITVESTVAQRNSYQPAVAESDRSVAPGNSTVANSGISKVVKRQTKNRDEYSQSLSISIDGNGRTPLNIWPAILQELQMVMGKFAHERLRMARLHSYDPGKHKLFIDIPDGDTGAGMWSTSAKNIERIIKAMTGTAVTVEWLPAGDSIPRITGED